MKSMHELHELQQIGCDVRMISRRLQRALGRSCTKAGLGWLRFGDSEKNVGFLWGSLKPEA